MKQIGSHQGRYVGSPKAGPGIRTDLVRDAPEPDKQPLNHEQQRIKKWLKQVRFKKAVFGGARESDVWKKIGELNAMYEAALSAERARYDALLSEHVLRHMENRMYTQTGSAPEQERAGNEAYE